jgi:predicted neuraminidase
MYKLLLLTAVLLSPSCKHVKSSEEGSASLASVPAAPVPENKGSYTQESIVGENEAQLNYNSTIVELSAENLMSCWFSGGREKDAVTKILCSEKNLTGNWASPRVIVDAIGKSVPSKMQTSSSPVLFKDQEGTIWLFYDVEEKDRVAISFKVSKDNGQTFSAEAKLKGETANLRSKPIQLSSGRFMMPVFKSIPKSSGYIVMLTPDQGVVRDSKNIAIPGIDHRTPALTIKEDERGVNKVFAYLSDVNAKNVIVSEYDFIAGSFSPIKNSNLPNSTSTVDAVTTDNNQILMIYNDSQSANSPLSLGVSDDGINFKKIWDFETASGDFSNPSFIRDQKGNYHLTYTHNQKTIRYVNFDSIWLSLRLSEKK